MRRRGGILLEILLSIAIFSGAAAFTLGAARSVLDGLDRSQRRQQMLDLARTRIAELECGLVTIAEVREEGRAGTDGGYVVDVETERTQFAGRTLVIMTVREAEGGGAVTLRQLVALQPRPPQLFETDPLLEGLPEPAPDPEPGDPPEAGSAPEDVAPGDGATP